jgi:predicted RNA-binding Zn-ribbon protein involved in translation (DUF1610 family)
MSYDSNTACLHPTVPWSSVPPYTVFFCPDCGEQFIIKETDP